MTCATCRWFHPFAGHCQNQANGTPLDPRNPAGAWTPADARSDRTCEHHAATEQAPNKKSGSQTAPLTTGGMQSGRKPEQTSDVDPDRADPVMNATSPTAGGQVKRRTMNRKEPAGWPTKARTPRQ